MKFLFLAALACLAVRLLAGRWPWELWGPNAKEAAEKRALNLLGLRADAGYDEVIEAHRRLMLKVHPDRGGARGQCGARPAAGADFQSRA